jgi:S1-C subfamily serine protease
MKPIPTGPAVPRKARAGPRRGSDLPTDFRSRVPSPYIAVRNRAIEDCARIAERYADRRALSTSAMAKDIAADIRGLRVSPWARADDASDFPRWAFV